MKKILLTIVVLGLLSAGGVTAAFADTLTVQFTVQATTGSLNGTTASGSFSFDSSIIPVGGKEIDQVGLLTNLSFTWNGISYTAANVKRVN